MIELVSLDTRACDHFAQGIPLVEIVSLRHQANGHMTDCWAELGKEHIESGGKHMWKNNSSGSSQVFDYTPPEAWRPSRLAKERSSLIALLERGEAKDEQGWLNLALRLPAGLRSALIKELAAGDWIVSVSDTGWPHPGSVVVTMCERFHATRKAPPQGVSWRAVNVPHYWREELSENSGGTAFLMIT